MVPSDGTSVVVRERHPQVTLVRSPENKGPAHARNLGAAAARGEWLLFLDADDTLFPGALTSLAAVTTPSTGLVTARYVDAVHRAGMHRGFLAGTFAVRHDVFRRIGGYDSALRFAENSELHMRLIPELERSRLLVVDMDTPVVRLLPPGQGRNYDQARLYAARHLLNKHSDYFAAHRKERAIHQAIVAVNADRLGEWRLARRYAGLAVRSEPGNPRHYARLARSALREIHVAMQRATAS